MVLTQFKKLFLFQSILINYVLFSCAVIDYNEILLRVRLLVPYLDFLFKSSALGNVRLN